MNISSILNIFFTRPRNFDFMEQSISQAAKFVLGKIPKILVIFLGKTTKGNFETWGKIILKE